jgi:hypothetical protein
MVKMTPKSARKVRKVPLVERVRRFKTSRNDRSNNLWEIMDRGGCKHNSILKWVRATSKNEFDVMHGSQLSLTLETRAEERNETAILECQVERASNY